MAKTVNRKTTVFKRERFEDTLVPREALFGLVTWNELVSTKHLGTEIHVFSEDCKELFFNGKKVKGLTKK